MWLLVSTTLLVIAAVKDPGYWRLLWLAMLVVDTAVVGYQIDGGLDSCERDSPPHSPVCPIGRLDIPRS